MNVGTTTRGAPFNVDTAGCVTIVPDQVVSQGSVVVPHDASSCWWAYTVPMLLASTSQRCPSFVGYTNTRGPFGTCTATGLLAPSSWSCAIQQSHTSRPAQAPEAGKICCSPGRRRGMKRFVQVSMHDDSSVPTLKVPHSVGSQPVLTPSPGPVRRRVLP